jgi:[acyl-carrier-protein] S-malonyltransferase
VKTAFLFPGQGAQSVGMAATLADTTLFDRASAVLGYDLLNVCRTGPAEKLNATDVSQPAIFVASLAALEDLKAKHPEVANDVVATAGLSLGEYTALVFAGAMSFEDGIQVVKARGDAMQAAATATPSGMVALLGSELADVEALVTDASAAGQIQIANYLCPGNTVVSGSAAAIAKLEELCQSKGGIKASKLAVAGAFHTSIMKPADEKLAAALGKTTISAPRIPVWSNVDAKPHTDPAEIRELLVKQVLSPVRWEDTLRGLLAAGVERFYEIGPGKALSGLMKRVQRKTDFINVTV